MVDYVASVTYDGHKAGLKTIAVTVDYRLVNEFSSTVPFDGSNEAVPREAGVSRGEFRTISKLAS